MVLFNHVFFEHTLPSIVIQSLFTIETCRSCLLKSSGLITHHVLPSGTLTSWYDTASTLDSL